MLRSLAKLALTMAILAAPLGCSTTDVSLTHEHSPSAPQSLGAYRWRPADAVGDPDLDDPHFGAVLRRAVDEQLTDKGYELADGGEATFEVGYRAALARAAGSDAGGSPADADGRIEMYTGRRSWEDSIRPRVARGTLTLEFSTPTDPSHYWRVMAARSVDLAASRQSLDAKLRDTVALGLRRFPAKSEIR